MLLPAALLLLPRASFVAQEDLYTGREEEEQEEEEERDDQAVAAVRVAPRRNPCQSLYGVHRSSCARSANDKADRCVHPPPTKEE